MKYISVIAFCSLGIIWGSNFIYMKMAAQFIEPMQVVFFRVLFGFIPVFIYALYSKALNLEDLKHYKHFIVMSLLAAVIYFFGFVKGSYLLLSGIAGALSGAIPLFSFLVAAIFLKDEKISKFAFWGVILGFIGVLLISGIFSTNLQNTNFEGVLYLIIASFSVGTSFIYAKKFVVPLNIKPVALTTYQLGFALLILLLIVDFTNANNIMKDLHSLVGMVVGLGVLGTGVAYILYYYMIETLGALKASSITYIPPIVALLIGFFLIGEDIKIIDFMATAFIFFGVFLINKRKKIEQ